jgi:hypothetical protein
MLNIVKTALLPLRRALSRWYRRSFLATMFDTYHPEQHYMRGPGPKSRDAHPGHVAHSERVE